MTLQVEFDLQIGLKYRTFVNLNQYHKPIKITTKWILSNQVFNL